MRSSSSDFTYLQQTSQIRDNEFLQRENLLLEAYLAKVDLAKIGITFEEDSSKVRCAG